MAPFLRAIASSRSNASERSTSSRQRSCDASNGTTQPVVVVELLEFWGGGEACWRRGLSLSAASYLLAAQPLLVQVRPHLRDLVVLGLEHDHHQHALRTLVRHAHLAQQPGLRGGRGSLGLGLGLGLG